MPDNVPTSGAWQTDPQLQQLIVAFNAAHAGPPSRGQGDAEALALRNYVDMNRARLGIPDNYTVNPQTGQLYDPNQNQIRDALLTGGAMAGAGVAAPIFAGAGAAPGGITSGMITNTAPSLGLATAPPAAAAIGSTAATAALPASQVIKNSLTKQFTTPQGIAQLAALIPTLRTLSSSGENPNSPFGANSPLMAEINKSLQMGNQRTSQAQPIYDALVNQAYGRTPTRYRGGAPSGYPAGGDAAPAGAYEFQPPRFGS